MQGGRLRARSARRGSAHGARPRSERSGRRDRGRLPTRALPCNAHAAGAAVGLSGPRSSPFAHDGAYAFAQNGASPSARNSAILAARSLEGGCSLWFFGHPIGASCPRGPLLDAILPAPCRPQGHDRAYEFEADTEAEGSAWLQAILQASGVLHALWDSKRTASGRASAVEAGAASPSIAASSATASASPTSRVATAGARPVRPFGADGRRLCPAGCGFVITWHKSHCCERCCERSREGSTGHDERCDRVPLEAPPTVLPSRSSAPRSSDENEADDEALRDASGGAGLGSVAASGGGAGGATSGAVDPLADWWRLRAGRGEGTGNCE